MNRNRNTLYTLCMAFLAAGIASCGKSTTSKITNNWTIVSSEKEQTEVYENGDKDYTRNSFTETTVVNHYEYTPSGGTIEVQENSGKVVSNTIEIKKDGTWIWNQELSYDTDFGGNTSNTTTKSIQSGTWNFLGKSKGDDFKKNERIALNILEENSSVIQTMNGVSENSNSSTTFLAGENMLIYTIVESKKKELEMKLEKNYQSTHDGEVSSVKINQTISLKEN